MVVEIEWEEEGVRGRVGDGGKRRRKPLGRLRDYRVRRGRGGGDGSCTSYCSNFDNRKKFTVSSIVDLYALCSCLTEI